MSTIEDADTPQEFLSALRKEVEKCNSSAIELQSAHQDKYAGRFWYKAATALQKTINTLEKEI